MDFDLVAAIVALIRGSAVGTAVGGRIFEVHQVPANALFPRCYIELRRSPQYDRYPIPDGAYDRHRYVAVLLAQSSQVSKQGFFDTQGWDKALNDLLPALSAPNLVWFRRIGEADMPPDANDLTSYTIGGGLYDAYFQYG